MTAIALSTFCDLTRSLGGYPNSRVFTNAVLTPWVNAAIGDYCDLLDDQQKGWRDTTPTGVTVASTATVALPTGTMSVRRVDIFVDGEWLGLDRLDPGMANSSSTTGVPRGYLHVGSNLELFPTPDAVYPLRFRIVPAVTKLVADGDTFDVPNGWEDFIVHLVLLRCYRRERRDSTDLLNDIGTIRARIVRATDKKDTSGPAYLPRPYEKRRRWILR